MKAAVFKGPGSLEVCSIPDPDCAENDVVLRVIACGICGSDLHTFRTGDFVNHDQVMGHEFVGEVVEVGKNVQGVTVGQRAVGFAANFCGECHWCKTNDFIYCPELFKTGTGYGRPGAFAEYVKIENAAINQNIFLVPDEITDEEAASIEPLGVAAQTVQQTHDPTYRKALVLGNGFIGNMVAQILKNVHGYEVAISEPSNLRRELSYGADKAINPLKDNVIDQIQDMWGEGPYHFGVGGMADLVVECAGINDTFSQALEAVRSRGTIALVALPDKPVDANVMRIVHKAPKIIGVLGSHMAEAINLLKNKKVNLDNLVTHNYPLEKIEEAFRIQQNAQVSVKVLVTPQY
ncbi:alcohol dehydrogenase [Pueribacillus theae]|uniref:Alcohol dehydrogenase n=1 Tax=Pueribacillus theae TaxID=2171751 RepID=A0A2U1K491_9BACI|nr:alcohol dehydrogenase catalytic domain-containing protein [Pueribacillus theae]PWA11793.1 alcohol dehydrogenase [Pueribacillus theae]